MGRLAEDREDRDTRYPAAASVSDQARSWLHMAAKLARRSAPAEITRAFQLGKQHLDLQMFDQVSYIYVQMPTPAEHHSRPASLDRQAFLCHSVRDATGPARHNIQG
jgi:hypothetical protein